MKLTGKCLDDFELWVNSEMYEIDNDCCDILLNALIIEFFDSTWIYVNVLRYNDKWKMIVENQFRYTFDSRQEAISEAIIKANELYNR